MCYSRIIKGIFLVAGTSIGGGILALPVLTCLSGYIPSIGIFILSWLFMASTGLMFLEICEWMEGETNIISMAENTLGKWGKRSAWILYLFLFYCLTIAYISGCGNHFAELFENFIPSWLGPILFVLIFSPFVWKGTEYAGFFNLFLMIGLFITYVFLVTIAFPYIKPEYLAYYDWRVTFFSLPIAFTSFAYQGIIPTLSNYLGKKNPHARLVLLVGSFIPFLIYLIWNTVMLGSINTFGPKGLLEALELNKDVTYSLKALTQNPLISIVSEYFAFFALSTSFFGVTLGLLDFLADGLKVKKDFTGKMLLFSLIFVPTTALSIFYPNLFLTMLELAGGLGCALLLGLLPILMLWKGRYYHKYPSIFIFPGKKAALVLLLIFVILEVISHISRLIFY